MSIAFSMVHYRRPDNVLRIVSAVSRWGLLDSITVVCPAGSVPLPRAELPPNVEVADRYPNNLTCRFEAALDKNPEYCLFADDDYVFQPSWVEAALGRLGKAPGSLVAGIGRTPHRRGMLWLYNFENEKGNSVFGLLPYLARRAVVERVFQPKHSLLRRYCDVTVNCEDLLLSMVADSVEIEWVHDHGFFRLPESQALSHRRTHWLLGSAFLNAPPVRRVIQERARR